MSELLSHWKREWSVWGEDVINTEGLPGSGSDRSAAAPHLWADTVSLSQRATTAVRDFANRRAVTLYMMSLAAMCVMLRALTDRARVGVMVHYANRRVPRFDNVLGWFANSHPLAIDFSSDPTLEQVVSRVREGVIRGQQHQELPFVPLLQEMLKTDPKNPAFSPTLVSVDFRRESETRIGKLLISPAIYRAAPAPLQLLGIERPQRLTLVARCTTGSLDTMAMRRMLNFSRAVLMMIVTDPNLRVSSCQGMLARTPADRLSFRAGASD
jgi:non-ribosomal peptide synthetase component F